MHPQEREFASLPPVNLLLDTPYGDDPSQVVATYHADWWNSPGGACTIPAANSDDETAAFNDWMKLANQVCASTHSLGLANYVYLSLSPTSWHQSLKITSCLTRMLQRGEF